MNQGKILNTIDHSISKEVAIIIFVTKNSHCLFNEPLISITGEEGTNEMSGNRIPVSYLSAKT